MHARIMRSYWVIALFGWITVGRAQVTVSSSDMSLASFSAVTFVGGLGGTAQFSQSLTGGNPGACGVVTLTVNGGPPPIGVDGSWVWLAEIYAGTTCHPSQLGGIDHIDAAADCALGTDVQNSGVVIQQNGQVYFADFGATPMGGWTTQSRLGLHSSDFVHILNSPTLFFDSASHPDLSSAGAPFQLGFIRGNSNGLASQYQGYTNLVTIDNWTVTVFPRAGLFCQGDGTAAACPCGNTGAPGHGCASSSFAGGAILTATGVAGASMGTDTLVLTATGIPGPGLFFQSNGLAGSPIPFGDGHLCASVGITRLGVVFPVAGSASYPGGLTPSPIHIAGGPISAGDLKHYQCWYRSVPGLCSASNYDLTQGLSITWGP